MSTQPGSADPEAPARPAGWGARLARVPQRLLMGLVRGYRYFLSPWLGSSCRFEPTCSRYALEALERHGAAAGSALAGWRLLRCHPWCAGGCDAVPERPPRLFSHLGLGARAAADPERPNPNPNPNPNRPLPGPTST